MGPPYGDESLPVIPPSSVHLGITGSTILSRTIDDLSLAATSGDVRGADRALGVLATLTDHTSTLTPTVLALAECTRARMDLLEGRTGGANLAAEVAVSLLSAGRSGAEPRARVHVLVTAASIAAETADVERARVRATEALATAQAALGPADVDTGAAWLAVSAACRAAGDRVGANAAREQASAIRNLDPP